MNVLNVLIIKKYIRIKYASIIFVETVSQIGTTLKKRLKSVASYYDY